jgi:hypothetical protein
MVKAVHSNKSPLTSVHSLIDGGEILTNQQLKYIYIPISNTSISCAAQV